MGTKLHSSVDLKLEILEKLHQGASIIELANQFKVGRNQIRWWILLERYGRLDSIGEPRFYERYSEDKKNQVVQAYLNHEGSEMMIAAKYGLRSCTQVHEWITCYNKGKRVTGKTPRKQALIMSGRKTSYDERLKIVEEMIIGGHDYKWAAKKYNVSYQQVYGWYQKYIKNQNNPESLRDRRGKNKDAADWTEMDRLKAENKILNNKLKRQEMEIAFAKKLVEIRNQEVKYSLFKKRFKP